MKGNVPLTGADIVALIAEVAEHLPHAGDRHTVVLVGGSLLAWHRLRESTYDVDSIAPIDAELAVAIRRVGELHDLDPAWLNANASPFAPVTLDRTQCDVLYEHPRLVVMGIPFIDLFLMKLSRAGAQDQADMRRIWPAIAHHFKNATELVDAFYAAYPLEEPDPYLPAFLADLAASAGHPIPIGSDRSGSRTQEPPPGRGFAASPESESN